MVHLETEGLRGILACEGSELALAFDDHVALGDARTWPPRIVHHHAIANAYPAARSASGTWLMQTCSGGEPPRTYSLVRLSGIDDGSPLVESTPLPRPDMSVLAPFMDATTLSIETAHHGSVGEMLFFGDAAVLVPQYLGIERPGRPLLHRRGEWQEARDLPAVTRAARDWKERDYVGSVRLGDGSDVLIWKGNAFELDGDVFARTFEAKIDAPWYRHRDARPVAIGRDGFVFLDESGRVVEVHRGGSEPSTWFAGATFQGLGLGPRGSIVVVTGESIFLYWPDTREVARIARDVTGLRTSRIHLVEGGLLLESGYPVTLVLVTNDEIEDLPRTPADDAQLADVPPPPTAPLTVGRSASRPRLCADSGRFYLANDRELRAFIGDKPAWRTTLDREIVAVAAPPDRVVALLDDGRLVSLAAEDGVWRGATTILSSPRSLASSCDGRLVVLGSNGAWLVDAEDGAPRRIAFEAPIAAAWSIAGDRVFLVGQNRRAAVLHLDPRAADLIVRDVEAPPEELHAIAPYGARWMALGPSAQWTFEEATGWTKTTACVPGAFVVASPDGRRVAWCKSARGLHVVDAGGAEVVHLYYGETFSEPPADAMAITGVAFDGEHLGVGLTRGRGNVLWPDSQRAAAFDGFEGDIRSQWLFLFGSHTYIASPS